MSDPQPLFAYTVGPVQEYEHLKDLFFFTITEKIPAVINGYIDVSPNLRKKFRRIRDSFREEFDPKLAGSLDQYILDQENRPSQDYELALANHFEQVLDAYEELRENIVLVPGPYDLSVEEMARFNEKHDLGVDEERFDEDRFLFTVCDGETTEVGGQGDELLGIGGATGFDRDLPDIVQHADFYLLTRTDWTSASEIIDKNPEYLVSSAGLSGTYDRERYDGGSFEIFNRKLSARKLVLDPCPDRGDLFHMTDITGGRPLIHGKVDSFDWTIHLVCSRPDDASCSLSVRVHEGKEPAMEFGYTPGEWIELDLPDAGDESEEAAAGSTSAESSSEEAGEEEEGTPVDRLKKWFDRQDPNLLVLVNDPDEFVEIIRMRLFDKADHFHILDSCEEALSTFQELHPSFIILEDSLDGSDAFLSKVKSKPGTDLVSIIKLYDEGHDPESTPPDFRVLEDQYLVEPFEMMELFAKIESELVRFSDRDQSRMHELTFTFRNTKKNVKKAERLGNQLIRNLDLDKSDFEGLRASFRSRLKEAVEKETQDEKRSRVHVSFQLSRQHLTMTVELPDGDFIKSMSEKLDTFPSTVAGS